MRKRAALGLAIAVVALLIVAPAAGAAARFASPTSTGTACTQAQPCGIVNAINKAAEGDDVTIGPGTYGPLNQELLDEGRSLAIHGQAGQPRPLIVSQTEYTLRLLGEKSSLGYLSIENAVGKYGFDVSANSDVSVDRVSSHVSAPGAIACYPSGTLTNSVCWSSGANGVAATVLALANGAASLRNDTLVASGAGGTAALAKAESTATMTLDLSNTIADGAGTDIAAITGSNPQAAATVNADHSNYATVKIANGGGGSTTSVTPAGSGTNQTGMPQFANAAAADFRELGSSAATIDRGENSPLVGAVDFDGNPRALAGFATCAPPSPSAITDIGAYEYVPPVPPCVPLPARGAAAAPIPKISKVKVDREVGSVTFTFGATGAQSGYQCLLKKPAGKGKKKPKATFTTCRSPKAYRHLRPGRYRFEVRALNSAGVPGAAAVRKFKLKPPRG